jgi:predicted ribosome quality control (RQC) complex YloA/Tae2 family protein
VSADRPLCLDAGHVAELVAELAPICAGRRVGACVAAVPRDVVLLLEAPGAEGGTERVRLRLSSDPSAPRLHLQRARQERPKGPLGPFFRRLEQDLAGARLTRLEQLGLDRAVALRFEESPSGERRTLVLELYGPRANLVLCGPGERVLEVLVPAAPGGKRPRLAPGEPWAPPGGPPRSAPAGPGRLAAALGPAQESLGELSADPRAPLSWLVETRLGTQADEAERERAASDLRDRLRRKLARAQSLVHGLELRAAAAGQAERVRLDGELAKLALPRLARGMASIEVEDVFGDSQPRKLELDPRRSPRENVELYFERYRKLLRAEVSVHQELELARGKQRDLAALLDELERPASDPQALERRALDSGLLEPRQEGDIRKRKAPEPRKPYRAFAGAHGSEIRVGRSARDNDELTFKHSRGNDVWLHTADAPGSHVVLRLDKVAEPDAEDLLDAAHLAVHFSPLRGAGRAQVHVARRKEVHKPRGAKPGLVTLSGGRVHSVRLQPERLRRLLQADRGQPGAEPEPS